MDSHSPPAPTYPLDSGGFLPVTVAHSPAQAALMEVSAGMKLAVWGIMGCVGGLGLVYMRLVLATHLRIWLISNLAYKQQVGFGCQYMESRWHLLRLF